MAITPIFRIRIGERHRKDMGNLQSLADSIALEGLLQPIGITPDFDLVFGERRLRACRDLLNWDEIETRVVNVSSIVAGEFHENEVRKDFTPSERVAIAESIKRELGERRGRPSEKTPANAGNFQGETDDHAAKMSGFGSADTLARARKVVEQGAPELVAAMDKDEVSISAAAEIADKPHDEQRKQLTLPTKKEAIEESKRTGAAVLGRDNKYHAYVPPERQARMDLWLEAKESLWAVSDLEVDAAAVVAAVPSYQREEFAQRIRRAAEVIEALRAEWEKVHGLVAAE
jgi:hypothetical protein